MANAEHLEALKLPGDQFNKWREENSIDNLDLTEINFADVFTTGISSSGGSYRKNSTGRFNLQNADFSGSSFAGVSFEHDCANARFHNCLMHPAIFSRCDFTGADFTGADCRGTLFHDCQFNHARIGADFYRAVLHNVDLEGVKNADAAKHLETVKVENQVVHFGLCNRSFAAKWLSWETIRNVGRLRLFAVSISLLGFLMVAVQCVGVYNDHVNGVLSWAGEAAETGNAAQRLLGQKLQQHLKPFLFSTTTSWLFVSIVLLGVASTIYNFACPDEVKEFTRSQWEHSLRRNVLHYWAFAWKYRYLRYVTAMLYAVGGSIFLIIMGYKMVVAFCCIAGYGRLLPF